MPKRKRSSKKAHRKIDTSEIETFVQDHVREQDELKSFAKKGNDELFIDDRHSPKLVEAPVKKKKKQLTVGEEVRLLQQKLKRRKIVPDPKESQPKAEQATETVYDLWAEPLKPELVNGGAQREWVDPALKKPILPPKWFTQKPSDLPAVEVDAGSSYRPTYDKHQDSLAEAVAIELKKKQKEKKWNRMLRGENPNAPRLENVPEVDDLSKKEGEDGEPEIKEEESEEERKEHNPFSMKLTKTQRNKMQRRKEQERARLKKYELKAQRRKFQKLPLMVKEVEEEVRIKAALQELKRRRKEERERLRTKRLGPFRFEDPMKPVLLSDELPSSLRALQSPANLFVDRLRSLQRRNLIEPRRKTTQKRKYKKKTYEKRSSKMDYELQ